MGYDLYIKARITEKSTGQVISTYRKNAPGTHTSDSEQWFTVTEGSTWEIYSMTEAIVEIINRYSEKQHDLRHENNIIIPRSALREICSCIFSHGCTNEKDRFLYRETKHNFWNKDIQDRDSDVPYAPVPAEGFADGEEYAETWDDKQSIEIQAVRMGTELLNMIWTLDTIHYENKLYVFDDDTEDPGYPEFVKKHITDRYAEAFKADPQAYEWEFMLVSC